METGVSGDDVKMRLAMEVADPWLVDAVAEDGDGASMALTRRLREDAARVKVRRVVAALNGVDVGRETAVAMAPPAIVTGEMVTALKAALCNDAVFSAMVDVIGEDDAGWLIGEIGML
jgi:hypothetical protein